jgi:hypothetical protein
MARSPKDPIAFGHLRQQNGWWHFRWTHPETGELGTKDKRKAGQVVNGKKVKGKWVPGLAEEIEQNGFLRVDRDMKRGNEERTFDAFANRYARHMEATGTWVETTAYSNQSVLRGLCEEFGNRPLGGISKKDVEDYVARRIGEEGRARSTINKALAFLKGMYKRVRGLVLA